MEGRTTLMWEGRRAALRLPELLPARTEHGMGRSSLFSTKCFAVFWFQIPGKSCACRRPTRREKATARLGEILSLCSWASCSPAMGQAPQGQRLGFFICFCVPGMTECN